MLARSLLSMTLLVPACGSDSTPAPRTCPVCLGHQKCDSDGACVADNFKKWVVWPQQITLSSAVGTGATLQVMTTRANYKYPLPETQLAVEQAAQDGFSTALVLELLAGVEVHAYRIPSAGGAIEEVAPRTKFTFTDADLGRGSAKFEGWGKIASITFGLRPLQPDAAMASKPLWPELGKACDGSPASCPSDLKCSFLQCSKTCPSVGLGPEYGCPTGAFCYAFDGIVRGECTRVCNTDAECGNPALTCKERSATEGLGLKLCVSG